MSRIPLNIHDVSPSGQDYLKKFSFFIIALFGKSCKKNVSILTIFTVKTKENLYIDRF